MNLKYQRTSVYILLNFPPALLFCFCIGFYKGDIIVREHSFLTDCPAKFCDIHSLLICWPKALHWVLQVFKVYYWRSDKNTSCIIFMFRTKENLKSKKYCPWNDKISKRFYWKHVAWKTSGSFLFDKCFYPFLFHLWFENTYADFLSHLNFNYCSISPRYIVNL